VLAAAPRAHYSTRGCQAASGSAKVRVDETRTPIAIDYFHLLAKQRGVVTFGIMEWIGDDVRFLMAPAGAPRPTDFTPGRER
jgi:hypothetical protein